MHYQSPTVHEMDLILQKICITVKNFVTIIVKINYLVQFSILQIYLFTVFYFIIIIYNLLII